jgi:G3E family GTPase
VSESAPITANILTGFLGAGKTSLLKRLLGRPELADTAVLINEFGEVGIDHLLIREVVDEEVVLLQSGCICCTIRGDLKAALLRLNARRRRGEVPAFARLVIETTGLADPAPIVATFGADPMLRHHYRLGNILTVVDAVDGMANLEAFEEARRQAAVADRLIVSKTDIAATAKTARLASALARINPAAPIVQGGADNELTSELLTSDLHDLAARGGVVQRWIEAERHRDEDRHHHEVDRSRHGDIRALVISEEMPLDWAAFGLWLSMLLNRHGGDVLRVKGLIRIRDREAPVVVQGVQHTIYKPVHLDRWPDEEARTRLVLIVRHLDPAMVERSFRAFVTKVRWVDRQ